MQAIAMLAIALVTFLVPSSKADGLIATHAGSHRLGGFRPSPTRTQTTERFHPQDVSRGGEVSGGSKKGQVDLLPRFLRGRQVQDTCPRTFLEGGCTEANGATTIDCGQILGTLSKVDLLELIDSILEPFLGYDTTPFCFPLLWLFCPYDNDGECCSAYYRSGIKSKCEVCADLCIICLVLVLTLHPILVLVSLTQMRSTSLSSMVFNSVRSAPLAKTSASLVRDATTLSVTPAIMGMMPLSVDSW